MSIRSSLEGSKMDQTGYQVSTDALSALPSEPRCDRLYLGCIADMASKADRKIAEGDRSLLALLVGVEDALLEADLLSDRSSHPVYVSTGRARGRPRDDTPEPLRELRNGS